MNVLVIDIGGTNVKILTTGQTERDGVEDLGGAERERRALDGHEICHRRRVPDQSTGDGIT